MRYIVAIMFTLMAASGGLHAQTRSSLLKGAKTYHLDITTGPSCPGVTEDYIRQKLSFPFSYSSLVPQEGGLNTDLWVNVVVFSDLSSDTRQICYGYARLEILSIHWNDPVPFNGVDIWAERPLWVASQIFTAMDKDGIGVIVEDMAKKFITDYNMDNK